MRASRMGVLAAALVAPLALIGAACAESPAMRAAESGNYPALRGEIEAREKQGNLTNDEAASLAKVVAERAIRSPGKDEDARERVRDVRACARELDDALEARMKTDDAAGAEAALARIEAGSLDASDMRAHATDANEHWRAVGIRAMTREEDERARQKALGDPSPVVRRQAIRAAEVAKDPADLPPLFDAARLDPMPIVRTDAIRAIQKLSAEPQTAARLRDLWEGADEGLREDIVAVWADPGVYGLGGREALRYLLTAKHGAAVAEAASIVVRVHESDAEMSSAAAAYLLGSIASASKRERLHAIAVARIDARKDTREAIKKASEDSDPDVRVAAFARMLDMPEYKAQAVKALEQAAQVKEGALGSRARFVLAQSGDAAVQLWIEWELASPDAYARLGAASALAALGRSARAAPLLADSSPQVRARVACTLLMAARSHK